MPCDTHKPYNKIVVENRRYWDYNFKILGVTFELSVNRDTGELYINKDEGQD